MTDILNTQEIIHLATLGLPKEMKNVISPSVILSVQILIRNGYLTSEKHNAESRLSDIASVNKAINIKDD